MSDLAGQAAGGGGQRTLSRASRASKPPWYDDNEMLIDQLNVRRTEKSGWLIVKRSNRKAIYFSADRDIMFPSGPTKKGHMKGDDHLTILAAELRLPDPRLLTPPSSVITRVDIVRVTPPGHLDEDDLREVLLYFDEEIVAPMLGAWRDGHAHGGRRVREAGRTIVALKKPPRCGLLGPQSAPPQQTAPLRSTLVAVQQAF